MYSHLEYLEQWFCETSIGCVPKVQIITGFDDDFNTGFDDDFINLYRLIFQIDFWNLFFKGVVVGCLLCSRPLRGLLLPRLAINLFPCLVAIS